ncbi:MAG TPA: DUF4386 domain-containing protein [Pyrinomonadaceae bacterium]|jgi:hypothetical protein
MERMAEASPRLKARIAGVLYLIIIVTATFAEIFVRGRLVVRSDAAATATNILAQESLYRLGGAADLINLVCDTALALLFYELLKPVGSSLSLLAAFFRLVHVAILAVSTLFHFAPLSFLTGAHDLSVFRAAQFQEQALLSLGLQARGYTITLVFFGFACLLLGILIYRSSFLPRILGVLMAIAGLCYVTGSFARLLSPAFAAYLFPYILLPSAFGEVSDPVAARDGRERSTMEGEGWHKREVTHLPKRSRLTSCSTGRASTSLFIINGSCAPVNSSVRPHGCVLVAPTGGGNGAGLRVP